LASSRNKGNQNEIVENGVTALAQGPSEGEARLVAKRVPNLSEPGSAQPETADAGGAINADADGQAARVRQQEAQ